MSANAETIAALVADVPLGRGHEDQERAVTAALRRLLMDGQRGVVLADEVGFGKTYEALAVLSHLYAHARQRNEPFQRALVLCKSALVGKWEEETSCTRTDRGFPRYLGPNHPARELFDHGVRCIHERTTAQKLRKGGLRGQRLDRRNQVPPGLYIVNERLLQEENRHASTLLRQLGRTRWDLVIVDEAHHYAHGNNPMYLFAPDGDLRNYDQPSSLQFNRILALTATPFELTPHELVNLLALVRVDPAVLDTIEKGLKKFVQALNRFFALRARSPADPLRLRQVESLRRMRVDDVLDENATGRGLQALLCRFLIRNTKRQNERRYFLVERGRGGFETSPFQKLDEDLQQRLRRSPLIPFEGEHALFYLELRELIQEVTARALDGEGSRTFIPTDLRQGLSSYRQIASSKLINQDLDSARRLKRLVKRWNKEGTLHPKVAALTAVVRGIVDDEIRKVNGNPDAWFSKVLVFNKMIRGTAHQLAKVLRKLLDDAFEQYLAELLRPMGTKREELVQKVQQAVDAQLDSAEHAMKSDMAHASWRDILCEFEHEDFAGHRERPFLGIFRKSLRQRAVQTLALIDLVRNASPRDDARIHTWVEQEVTGRVVQRVRGVIRYLYEVRPDEPRETILERAERDLLVELEESKAIGLVGRFDGKNPQLRDAHRRNFNRRHNPFVLLVGQVGEEGIDLQEQCRYVIHYDLEWNPARMEQREGRVDRMGWGRASEKYIDVRFLLLKGTYEERIFHTVMQRDQWFQILIGSKKKKLGPRPKKDEQEDEQEDKQEATGDQIEDDGTRGMLTDSEKAHVMLDLSPK